jgi:hypothetical protein
MGPAPDAAVTSFPQSISAMLVVLASLITVAPGTFAPLLKSHRQLGRARPSAIGRSMP